MQSEDRHVHGYLIDRLVQRKSFDRTAHLASGFEFVELRRAELRMRIAGEGPVVVCCPDPPNVLEQQDQIIGHLSARCKVVCYEQPGFGFSRVRGDFDFSPAHYADVLIELLEVLDLGPVTLALPCVSGFFALDVARRRRELVAKVCLIQTPSLAAEHAWLRGVSGGGVLTTPFLGQFMIHAKPVTLASHWYARTTPRHQELGLLDTTMSALRAGGGNCMASALQAFSRLSESSLGPVSQPGLIIWGSDDPTHTQTDGLSARAYLANAPSVMLPTGHFPELEDPEAVAMHLHAFTSQHTLSQDRAHAT